MPAKADPADIEIRIHGLCKAFDGVQVLRGVDLTIDKGETLAIVGGSGCGKTVLMNHVLGQLIADRGSIEVVNHDAPAAPLVNLHDVGDMDLDAIHRHWGVVFQRNALFSGTVYENIALWLREVKNLPDSRIRPVARGALKAVGLPDNDAFLDQPQEKLSGGMAKRLAVARAIAMDPNVIFYDEPTTGLDPVSSAQIYNLINQTHHAMPGRTTIIITHDKDLLSRLRPRVIMLNEGRVSFDGGFGAFAASDSPIIVPYFQAMPLLQLRTQPPPRTMPDGPRRGLCIAPPG